MACSEGLSTKKIDCLPEVYCGNRIEGIQFNPINGMVYDGAWNFLGWGFPIIKENGNGIMNIYDTEEEFKIELAKFNNKS